MMSLPRGGLLAGASVMGVSASGVWDFLAARTLAGVIEYFVVTRVYGSVGKSVVCPIYEQIGDPRDKHTVVGLASRSCAERVSHSCDDSMKGIVNDGLRHWRRFRHVVFFRGFGM